MAALSQNGNGKAVTILPPTAPAISGRSLVHRQLDKRQLACLAADVIEGLTTIDPTQSQVATLFGVSLAYIRVALRLDPGKRAAIVRGWDPTSFANLVKPRRKVLAITDASNASLVDLIRKIGVERVLEAACAAEAAE
jgi:hypothetical protein